MSLQTEYVRACGGDFTLAVFASQSRLWVNTAKTAQQKYIQGICTRYTQNASYSKLMDGVEVKTGKQLFIQLIQNLSELLQRLTFSIGGRRGDGDDY